MAGAESVGGEDRPHPGHRFPAGEDGPWILGAARGLLGGRPVSTVLWSSYIWERISEPLLTTRSPALRPFLTTTKSLVLLLDLQLPPLEQVGVLARPAPFWTKA